MLKKAFTKVLVLVRWNPESKIIVKTDASDRACKGTAYSSLDNLVWVSVI